MPDKIGVGLITCNRPEFFAACYNSLPLSKIDELVVVNDGDKITLPEALRPQHYIHHRTNKGVGVSKNDALSHLIARDCDHLFLIEDDIIIKRPDVFEKYIAAVKQTGLEHLMFGYHGPANKRNGKNNPRLVVEYSADLSIDFNVHCVGAFCYYSKSIIVKVGYMDEKYKNAWEHVSHSYDIVKSGALPSYWYWPDLSNSCDLLSEQACSEVNSSIRPRADWQKNIQEGAMHFISKHGHSPVSVPPKTDTQVREHLQQLYLKTKKS